MSAFDDLWMQLVASATSGSFNYRTSDGLFRSAVDGHFRDAGIADRFGVYVVRRIEDNEVLYIGKAGTIAPDGKFKSQGVRGRLKAVRGVVQSDVWFANICGECGAFRVDYLFLSPSPLSPALAEAKLLQEFLNKNGHLPRYNRAF